MVRKLSHAVSLEAMYLRGLVQFLPDAVPLSPGLLPRLGYFPGRQVLARILQALFLLCPGRNELQDASRPSGNGRLQGQVTAIGKHQFVKLDANLPIRGEIGVQGCDGTPLLRDCGDLRDLAVDLAAGWDHKPVKRVYRLRNFPMNWLTNLADAYFLIQCHLQWCSCRYVQ